LKKKDNLASKKKFNLDKNISIIYWEDDNHNYDFHNSNLEGIRAMNLQEYDRILIMNIENNLLFLELNNLECVIYFLLLYI